jgi:voltage-gated sodium channel
LGIETYPSLVKEYSVLLYYVDVSFIIFFIIELVLKLLTYRKEFFRSGWNIFDFCVVIITILPMLGNVSALRAVRILRALRLISGIPSFRRVIESIFKAASEFTAVLGVLLIVVYIYAVMGSKLFHGYSAEHFGDLGSAMFTMFQVMTLDAWSDIARPIITQSPLAGLVFFISFIGIAVFLLLSIVVGIASNALQSARMHPPH